MDLSTEPKSLLLDKDYLNDLRRQMFRFALLQISDTAAAEDAVQEALAGALKNAESFTASAAFKTWVFAILKHKITDHFRRQKHLTSEAVDIDTPSDLDDPFKAIGLWSAGKRPGVWPNPDQALEDKHFWRVFDSCLEHLPGQQARVFMMREFIGLSADEICESLSLSVSNLHVLLHRARLRLRGCLEEHWFKVNRP
ncbi:sigma-70 family RNA polymerase sigma factor [Gilvimarinus polysaccharolyticus]|uniref:sigma-70 family RNA polymerase sigma factor n=1 Tax=Gilvimarinus polysaccharolyticus TaxID=863921 RepID=UPI00067389F2|nr:sigma-70 family RNA polymerase sigma factor [Gilvimarinus polysaccharolyticus]